jgi:hypothetical protein
LRAIDLVAEYNEAEDKKEAITELARRNDCKQTDIVELLMHCGVKITCRSVGVSKNSQLGRDIIFRQLYSLGLTDAEIAGIMGCQEAGVKTRRCKLKLPVNK